jgi:hypothetical protein
VEPLNVSNRNLWFLKVRLISRPTSWRFIWDERQRLNYGTCEEWKSIFSIMCPVVELVDDDGRKSSQ